MKEVTVTCPCGASLSGSDDFGAMLEIMVRKFNEAHAACRAAYVKRSTPVQGPDK